MAAALARASFAGAAARLSVAEMMEVRGGRVAPEASAWAGEEADPWGLPDGSRRKPALQNFAIRRFCY